MLGAQPHECHHFFVLMDAAYILHSHPFCGTHDARVLSIYRGFNKTGHLIYTQNAILRTPPALQFAMSNLSHYDLFPAEMPGQSFETMCKELCKAVVLLRQKDVNKELPSAILCLMVNRVVAKALSAGDSLVNMLKLLLPGEKEVPKAFHLEAVVDGTRAGESSLKLEEGRFTLICYDQKNGAAPRELELRFSDEERRQVGRLQFAIPRDAEIFSKQTIAVDMGGSMVELGFYNARVDPMEGKEFNDCRIMGHRGCGMTDLKYSSYNENTLSSFLEAYRRRAKWVELDVHLTKDKEVVIYHDFLVSREGEKAAINEITLKKFLWFVDNEKEEDSNKPCTFRRVLDSIPHDLGVNVEIKYPPRSAIAKYKPKNIVPEEEYILGIVGLLEEKKRNKVIFSSFNPYIILLLRMRVPRAVTYILSDGKENAEGDVYTRSLFGALLLSTMLELNGVVLDYDCMAGKEKPILQTFASFGLKVLVYGDAMNSRNKVELVLRCGAQGVITDDVEILPGQHYDI
jgi:glycerophosphodiester phosphodiesterase